MTREIAGLRTEESNDWAHRSTTSAEAEREGEVDVDVDAGPLYSHSYGDQHLDITPVRGHEGNRALRTAHGQWQGSRPVSASSSNADGAGVQVERQRSVLFSGPPSPPSSPSRGRAGNMAFGSRGEQLVAERSSADEITPMFGQVGPKGGGGGGGGVGGAEGAIRDYNTQTRTQTAKPEVGMAGEGSGFASRRAGNKSQTVAERGGGEASREHSGTIDRPDREGTSRRHRDFSWKRVAEQCGSAELDNKGSVARDHLALERTFLAWLRTSLAFASIGIAVTQLFRLNTSMAERAGYTPSPSSPSSPAEPHSTTTSSTTTTADAAFHLGQVGKPLGATFLGIAIVVLFVGFHRYFESQHWIIRGKFPASRGSVALVAGVAGALIVGSLVVVVCVDPTVWRGG